MMALRYEPTEEWEEGEGEGKGEGINCNDGVEIKIGAIMIMEKDLKWSLKVNFGVLKLNIIKVYIIKFPLSRFII